MQFVLLFLKESRMMFDIWIISIKAKTTQTGEGSLQQSEIVRIAAFLWFRKLQAETFTSGLDILEWNFSLNASAWTRLWWLMDSDDVIRKSTRWLNNFLCDVMNCCFDVLRKQHQMQSVSRNYFNCGTQCYPKNIHGNWKNSPLRINYSYEKFWEFKTFAKFFHHQFDLFRMNYAHA